MKRTKFTESQIIKILAEQKNGINLSVSWQNGKLSKLAGRAIKMRFEIENASLYAFGFTN